MPIIDADTHVVETEHTWDFMEEKEQAFRPTVLVPKDGPTFLGGLCGHVQEFWYMEGRAFEKRSDFLGKEMSEGAKEVSDIQARLAHMDELSVDVQVLFPTLFLRPLTRQPKVEVALCRSYNR
jgi:hypothetical protein